MIKKRLNFVSNSSSQSFIINSENNSIEEVKKYIYETLQKAGYKLEYIKKNVDIYFYKDILKKKNQSKDKYSHWKFIDNELHNWYDKDNNWKNWEVKIHPDDIIVFITDNYWPYDDHDETSWFELTPLLKRFKIYKTHKWSMHMG